MTTNQIEYAKHKETQRHNLAVEGETNRANLAKEAETQRYNTLWVGETERSNRANEEIKSQANVINAGHYARQDAETRRSNLANEAIKRSQVGLGYAQLGKDYAYLEEQNRHNQVTENQTWGNLFETQRHNQSVENETVTHNRNSEAISRTGNRINAFEADTRRGQLEVSQRLAGYKGRETAATESSIANQNINRNINTGINAVNAVSNLIRNVGGVINAAERNKINKSRSGSGNGNKWSEWWDNLDKIIDEQEEEGQ